MHKLLFLFLLTISIAAANVNFYFTIESIPESLPGSGTASGGILVLVRMPVDSASVCIDFSAPDGTHHVCADISGDTEYAYAATYLPLGFDASEVSITSISVTSGGETKTVDNPVPAFEY